ncbi:MAG TPA: bifunctional oligoribonuclease/PAP phosphatase NrnA [Actinomycetota bacterium]|nr:bifunctional oligoribonuclease/PAP phosphatase NrnA [Actinomycetota bacterium]
MIEDAIARAAATLSKAPAVAIACHVNPDTDALGSMLGLGLHLRERGASVTCSFPNDPPDLPAWASALPGTELLVGPGAFPAAPAVMVTCDCASFDRLGMLGAAAEAAAELIWIDHHRSNDGLGSIRVVDPSASSTCELVVRLLDAIGGTLGRDAALCLYAGIVTDTGRFQYEATTPETLRIAARLRELPFDHARLSQALFEDRRAGALRLLAVALDRLREEPGADLVWTYLTRDDLERAGGESSDADDLIDVVRTLRGADVAAFLKQQADGRFKVSVRSRGDHDLAAIASAFGGGGHRLAAGYTSERGPAGTIEMLAAALAAQPAPA